MATLNSNHISLTSSNDIQAICNPLIQHFGITYFDFTRRYANDYVAILTNQAEILDVFVQKNFAISHKDQYTKSQSVFWSADKDIVSYDDQLALGRSIFKIDHGFTIIEVHENYNDIYAFATTPENSNIINFYLNNQNLLQQFIFYFKDKAKNLIQQATKKSNLIYMPSRPVSSSGCTTVNEIPEGIISLFKQQIDTKQFIFNDGPHQIILSQQEVDCLIYLAQGKSAREIGIVFNRSTRTIEDYVERLKNKLHCANKAELILTAHRLNILAIKT